MAVDLLLYACGQHPASLYLKPVAGDISRIKNLAAAAAIFIV